MARFDTNRSAEMEVFVRVVDLGGFTQAARKLRLTPSGVSKLISRLETRLGTRLVNRTTRKLTLTEEGRAFYERAVRILAEMEEAEREAASGAAPRGRLTVNCNIPFGMLHVMPLLPRFLEQHPEVTLDLVLTDTLIDLMQERADVAIRAGPLRASRLVARKLGTSRMVVVGAPNYLARSGTPKSPADLADHRGIGWTFPRSIRAWPFKRGDHTEEIVPPPVARASDGEAARPPRAWRRRPRPSRPLPHRPRHRVRPARAGAAKLQSRRPRRHSRRLCRPHRAAPRARPRVHRLPRRACAGERSGAEACGGWKVEIGGMRLTAPAAPAELHRRSVRPFPNAHFTHSFPACCLDAPYLTARSSGRTHVPKQYRSHRRSSAPRLNRAASGCFAHHMSGTQHCGSSPLWNVHSISAFPHRPLPAIPEVRFEVPAAIEQNYRVGVTQ